MMQPSTSFEGLQLDDGTLLPGFVHDVQVAALNGFVTWTYGQVRLASGTHKMLEVGDRVYVGTQIGIQDAWIERIDVDERGVEVHWTTRRRTGR